MLYPGEHDCDDRREAKAATTKATEAAASTSAIAPEASNRIAQC